MGVTQPDARGDSLGGRALERQALEFFARWGESFDAFAASFELLAEDCVWDQRPIPRLVGPRAAVRFLTLARRTLGVETCDVEIVRLASEGTVVHVERVDRLRRADGSLIVAAPVAGVLTFSGGPSDPLARVLRLRRVRCAGARHECRPPRVALRGRRARGVPVDPEGRPRSARRLTVVVRRRARGHRAVSAGRVFMVT